MPEAFFISPCVLCASSARQTLGAHDSYPMINKLIKLILPSLFLCGLLAIACGDKPDASPAGAFQAKSGHVAFTQLSPHPYMYGGMWQMRDGRYRLVFLFLKPWGATGLSHTTADPDRGPADFPIEVIPKGLYQNGTAVPLGRGRRVFVYTKERKMRPVPLTDAELALLTPEKIGDAAETKVWQEKILPILEEEDWTRVCADGCHEQSGRVGQE